ncbi:MAG: hypothetical protein UX87_C0003G0025 [Candidatus Amesbacteria bacterium GW2011_GWA1_47_16]|uniref:Uncharacterized protein n=2 Tax=Candidatus Amesiibacteriota TaxID=1752730 RepID=A0A1F4Z1E4_9BACT|nr:MAG: hypothetical protein UX87_C0003G0025 [Candidatus Amesbacteria bacterium GW2011_GWA1_47_16]OGC99843.1 MAG: hypothetical protein A2701_02810 [Candidatus Amesbacteria bacterium RIFCSPHIGHO2_01_FULL_47_34]OGD00073.1 MAG: hypothetical protein A2972_00990 [Candidatus Amesbacteria bacterium RIFCSPLOWO2_01_FULL_47_33]
MKDWKVRSNKVIYEDEIQSRSANPYGRPEKGLGPGVLVIALPIIGILGWLGIRSLGGNAEARSVNNSESPAIGWCSVDVLDDYFGMAAGQASCVCLKESSGRPKAIGTYSPNEYSIGLFQKNLKDGITEENFINNSGTEAARVLKNILERHNVDNCSTGLRGNRALLQECVNFYSTPEFNLIWAAWFHEQSGWNPWKWAMAKCDIK